MEDERDTMTTTRKEIQMALVVGERGGTIEGDLIVIDLNGIQRLKDNYYLIQTDRRIPLSHGIECAGHVLSSDQLSSLFSSIKK